LVEEYGCKPERIVCAYVFSISDPNHPKPNVEKYSSKNILFVGIDWERKGGPDLVEAFRSVLRVHPDARLTIVGCTPRIDLPNCTVVGRIPIDQVSQHYSQAAVFCMPTKAEPFGIVFVEAMMRRLPIVSTNIGALPDIVSHGINGYLVKTGDSVELAKHLTDLVGNPTLCKHMGESSYRKASERYTRQNVGATLKRNIERVLNGRAREHTTEFSSISES
jgi:glycosyltransferase involved in cell wall biosynthesis